MSESEIAKSIDVNELLAKFAALSVNSSPGVVSVPSSDKGDFVTLKFGLQHFISEAAKYRIREDSLTKTDVLAKSLTRIEKFLKAAEDQVGSDNVKAFRVPFFYEVLNNTSLEFLADEPDKTWREIIAHVRELFQIEAVSEDELFSQMLAIAPGEKITIKQALIKVISVFKRAQRESALSILPPATIIAKTIV